MFIMLIKILITVVLAFLMGKLVAKLKLPAILGWLIAGMILGPHALSLMSDAILEASWYKSVCHVLECGVGLMIGSELVWNKIKKSGKAIVVTTLYQSIGTFLVVSLVFGMLFYFTNIPVYLGFIFGGIALATAPAPALSVVREFKTDGPVTRTLIPMAALDDIVGCVVFFVTITLVSSALSGQGLSFSMIALIVVLPLLIGAICGVLASFVLKREQSDRQTLITVIIMIVLTSLVGFFFNNVILKSDSLNFMLIGMAFSAAFANMISQKRLDQIMKVFNPILGVALIIVIVNLGAPLDYHLILGAGLYTLIYILSRAFGKYFGAYLGAKVTGLPETVKKYLGLTLLPHSGVSLVFTGIAVSTLSPFAPEEAQIVQGTIAAAAVINEIIAVLIAKKGFELAGEFNKLESSNAPSDQKQVIITISRQYGSGGHDIGEILAKQLSIPMYDKEIIEKAAMTSDINHEMFDDDKRDRNQGILKDLSDALPYNGIVDEKMYRHQSKIIKDYADEGSCVIVGRNGDDVLESYQSVIKVFIYAPLDIRKATIAKRLDTDLDNASKLIATNDKRRAEYYEHFTHKQYGYAGNYDLCLNTGVDSYEACAKKISELYLKLASN